METSLGGTIGVGGAGFVGVAFTVASRTGLSAAGALVLVTCPGIPAREEAHRSAAVQDPSPGSMRRSRQRRRPRQRKRLRTTGMGRGKEQE
jgi:hypothetical protein